MSVEEPLYVPSDIQYPILIIPKSCTKLECQDDVNQLVYINAAITTPNVDGIDTCLYAGLLNIKLIDSYDVEVQGFNRFIPKAPEKAEAELMQEIGVLPVILADHERPDYQISDTLTNTSPSIQNGIQNDHKVHYAIRHHTVSNNITVEQHNTFITQNIYNLKNAVHYGHHQNYIDKTLERNYDPTRPMNLEEVYDYEVLKYPYQKNGSEQLFLNHQDIERACNAYEEPQYEDMFNNEIQTISNVDPEYAERCEMDALKQLFSQDIAPVSKQQKRIMYLGADAQRGQTIQQIAYNDPKLECAMLPIHVENEVVIESSEPLLNRKKYQCAKCQQIFDQLSAFREHMGNHKTARTISKPRTNRTVSKNRGRSRSPNPAKYVCPECGKTLNDQHKFEIHFLAHGDPDLECPKCRKVYASKFTLRAHLKIHQRKYACVCCDRTYAELKALRAHMSRQHLLFMCADCDFVAPTNSMLTEHEDIHKIIYKKVDVCDSNDCFCHGNTDDSLRLLDAETSEHRGWACNGYEIVIENAIEPKKTIENGQPEDIIRHVVELQEIPTKNEFELNTIPADSVKTDDKEKIIKENHQQDSKENQDKEKECDKTVDYEKSQAKTANQETNHAVNYIDQAAYQENMSYTNNPVYYNKDQDLKAVHQKDNVENKNDKDQTPVYQEEAHTEFSDSEDSATEYCSDSDWCQGEHDDETSGSSSSTENRRTNNKRNDSVIAKALSNQAFLSSNSTRTKKLNKMCDVCLKRFDRVSDLKRHLIEHVIRSTLAKMPVSQHGILKITCEVCHQRTFNKVDQYKAHLREHANLTLYQCTFCKKSFSDSSNFSKHKKLHSDTFFQCDLCKRKFNSKRMLIQHMEYHNKHSPLSCHLCKKTFFFESTLKKHLKSAHSKQTKSRFRCKFCLKYFSTLKAKWDHEWRKHNARRMVVDCLMCGAKYRKYSELKRHCHQEHEFGIPTAKHLLSVEQSAVSYKAPR